MSKLTTLVKGSGSLATLMSLVLFVALSVGCPGTAPSVSMNSTVPNPVGASSLPVNISFSKSVTGFDASDIRVANASLTGFTGSGSSYSVTLKPLSSGLVTANIDANVCKDSSGVYNSASPTFSRTCDTTAPMITASSTAPSLTNVAPVPVLVVFSETVTGFDAGDVVVTNGSVSGFSGSGATYNFNVSPSADGLVSISIPAGAAVDVAGNATSNVAQLSRTYDGNGPTCTMASPAANPTSQSPIPVAMTFSEPVSGLSASDLVVSNAAVSGFSGSGVSYSFNLVPNGPGAVTAELSNGFDSAGNPLKEATQFSREYVVNSPSVSLASPAGDQVDTPSIPVSATFSVPVAGFAASDVVASNAGVTNFAGSGASYSFILVPQSAGVVTVTIPAGCAVCDDGNANLASQTLSFNYSTPSELTVAMSSSLTSPTTAFPIPVKVEFSEAVTGFTASDVTVSNAVLGSFTGSGATYNFNLTPQDEGTLTADIAANAAQTAAGKGNSAAPQFSISFVTQPAPEAVAEVFNSEWMAGAPVSATQSYAPMAVFFEGWKSEPREEITKYEWNFGDGSETFQGFNAAHVYEQPGTYNATLTVTNKFGWSSIDSVTIQVFAPNGTTYYVDSELGNDSNAGTAQGSGAWKTAARAFGQKGLPGDRILFNRGQIFPVAVGAISSNGWRNVYGVMFGAYGTGSKPLIKLSGSSSGNLFPTASTAGHMTISDLAFDLTSAEGATAAMLQWTGNVQNPLFLRVDVSNCANGYLMQSQVTGPFFVESSVVNSTAVQLYTTCARIVTLNSLFDLSGNHNAYLEVVNKGVFTGSTFGRCVFGRHAFRMSGRDNPTTNNVVITNNNFVGWIEPGGTRYNWMLVHLAPNVTDLQIMKDVIFENNTLSDAETLLNVGNYENLVVRNNVMTTKDTYEAARRIIIGSKHSFDTMPCKNILFTENVIQTRAIASPGVASVFSVLAYNKAAYEGRSLHEDIRIEKNVVMFDGGISRVLWFEANNAAQIAEVSIDNNILINAAQNAQLYQVTGGFYTGTYYTLEQWRGMTGTDAGTQIYASNALPVPGWAVTTPANFTAPFSVAYNGAWDLSGAGLKEVRLWVRKNSGAWTDTGLKAANPEGVFEFAPSGAGSYAFALQAQDHAGNTSPVPQGDGHCLTVFGS